MKHALIAALAGLTLFCGAPAMAAPAPIVFFDIAGQDSAKQAAFYAAVFDWKIGPGGQVQVPVTAPLSGTLRQDPSMVGIYLGVPDVTAALAKVVANGGSIITPRFEVPGVVTLGLFKDPAGNALGLVEMDGDHPKVPKPK